MQVLGRDSRPWLQPYLQLVLTMMRPQVPCSHSVSIPQTAALGGRRLWWFRSLKRLHSESRCISGIFHMGQLIFIPIGSMYGIYANIWGILMVNVTIYSIHGSYGIYQLYSVILVMLVKRRRYWNARALCQQLDCVIGANICTCLPSSDPRFAQHVKAGCLMRPQSSPRAVYVERSLCIAATLI